MTLARLNLRFVLDQCLTIRACLGFSTAHLLNWITRCHFGNSTKWVDRGTVRMRQRTQICRGRCSTLVPSYWLVEMSALSFQKTRSPHLIPGQPKNRIWFSPYRVVAVAEVLSSCPTR